ncbi:pyridoxal 5'-phosphate synthase glutaminase subunit PdxT [Candidatus Bathyarchaeota archaeon]|nr:MAG: pyridoxal 5'-phosphate synthase glutaminase subunit PdxT [Candidatus Bathyarchaeota archaeon]
MTLKIGVLGVQGAVSEHVEALNDTLKMMNLEGSVVIVKNLSQLENVHGLVIPGGESTTIGRVAKEKGLMDKIIRKAEEGLPVLGTCAGLVLLAKEVYDAKIGVTKQPLLGLMNIKVIRNAFGRQRESFEVDLEIPVLGEKPFPAVFIRAPIVEKVWGETKILAKYENKIVAVQEKNLLAAAFHPELVDDRRFHQYFVRIVLSKK